MNFTLSNKKIPVRRDELLVRQPTEEGIIPYDLVAPGIYPDEDIVILDTGETVAVSVARTRLPNGQGMEFRAWARQIKEDGSTVLDSNGVEIENVILHTASTAWLLAVGADSEEKVSREMLLAVLGEEETLRPIVSDPAAPAIEEIPEGTTLDEEATHTPLIGHGNDVRQNANIRDAIRLANVSLEGNASALLRMS